MQKQLNSLALLTLILCAGCTGCQMFPALSPEADPLVVRAEQASTTSLEIVHSFIKFEKQNRTVLGPNVKAVADELRVKFPPVWRELRSTTKLYKADRTDQNRSSLDKVLISIQGFVAMAEKALLAVPPPPVVQPTPP